MLLISDWHNALHFAVNTLAGIRGHKGPLDDAALPRETVFAERRCSYAPILADQRAQDRLVTSAPPHPGRAG
jgi:hypothetical protein